MKNLLLALACAGLVVFTRLPWFGDHIFNVDLAVRGALAWGWSEGLVPLRDLYGSTKPPGLDLLYLGIFKTFGVSLLALQWLGLVLTLATSLAVGLLAKALFDTRAAFYAAFGYVGATCFAFRPIDWLEPSTEYVSMLLVLLAALCLLPLGRGGSSLWGFPAGLLLAEAAFVRQNSLLFAFPLALGFGLMAWQKRPKAVPLALVAGLLGLLAGFIPWIWYYHSLGELDALVLFGWTLPGLYTLGASPLTWLADIPLKLGGRTLVYAPVAWPGLWYVLQKEEGSRLKGAKLLVLLLLLGGLASVSLGGRFQGHYFLMLAPFSALAAAGAIAVMGSSGKPCETGPSSRERWLRTLLVCFVVWLVLGALRTSMPPLKAYVASDATSLERYYKGQRAFTPALVELVRQNTQPGSRIAVFGSPSLYLKSDRLPAARDFWGNFLTGYKGHNSNPEAFKFAECDWAEDLAEGEAALVVDIGQMGEANPRLTDYPLIARALEQHYRYSPELSTKAPGVKVWVRKTRRL